MNCKHFKIRTKNYKKYYYCKLLKRETRFSLCRECDKKEYKRYNPIKKRTNKLSKNENNRFSIIYPDLTKCCVCGLKKGDFDSRINMYTWIEKNEVFEGAYRLTSIKEGMITPFCKYHHDMFHSDTKFNLKFKVMFQKKYMETHTLEEFVKLFKQDYIFKSKKDNKKR